MFVILCFPFQLRNLFLGLSVWSKKAELWKCICFGELTSINLSVFPLLACFVSCWKYRNFLEKTKEDWRSHCPSLETSSRRWLLLQGSALPTGCHRTFDNQHGTLGAGQKSTQSTWSLTLQACLGEERDELTATQVGFVKLNGWVRDWAEAPHEGILCLICIWQQGSDYIIQQNSRQAVAEVLWKSKCWNKRQGQSGEAVMKFWEDYWFIEWRSKLLSKKAGNLSTNRLNVETRNFNIEQEKTVHTSVNEAFRKAK